MDRPKLTIGMANYDDFNGCYFTLQNLRLHHDLKHVELLLIDNHPNCVDSRGIDGRSGLRGLINNWFQYNNAGARYIAAPEIVGTSFPRDRVFREARGEAVLCIDSHVLIPAGIIAKLIKWYDDHPDSMDLL